MSSSGCLFVGAVLIGGAVLYAIAVGILTLAARIVRNRHSSLSRSAFVAYDEADVATQWTQSVGTPPETPLDVAARLEMIDRLALVGEAWCVQTLEEAAREERNPVVASAIEHALATLSPIAHALSP